jgi:hypothetical protein
LRTNRETTPEGFHDEVLSDHITRNREASQQVNDPQSLPAHEVARVRPDPACVIRRGYCRCQALSGPGPGAREVLFFDGTADASQMPPEGV